MKIVVLGCGPSGLMAVHAAVKEGHDVLIFSKARKSEMYGAQYLHRHIPGLPGEAHMINYEMRGTADQYRNKVYGSDYRGTVSPEELEGHHMGWDIRAAYDELWAVYGPYVQDQTFDRQLLNHLLTTEPLIKEADLVISSLPANLLCMNDEHSFLGEEIYAIGDAPERGISSPISAPPFTVVCNGEPDVSWYRTSNVFGFSTTEWPGKRKPPVEGVAKVVKPLKTTCTCHPNVVRVGRYGQWKKGVLADSAFFEVQKLVGGPVQEALF